MNALTADQKKHIEKHVETHLEKHLEKHALIQLDLFNAQFKKHVSTAIIAALSFLIALSWKDLIVHLVSYEMSPEIIEAYPYLSYLISALIVTFIALVGIALITKWSKRTEIITSETTQA